MWTTEIVSKQIADKQLVVEVKARKEAHPDEVFTVPWFGSQDDLRAGILRELARIDDLETRRDSLSLGAFDLTAQEVPLSDDEKKKLAQEKALSDLYEAKNNLGLGIIKQADYDAVLAAYTALTK